MKKAKGRKDLLSPGGEIFKKTQKVQMNNKKDTYIKAYGKFSKDVVRAFYRFLDHPSGTYTEIRAIHPQSRKVKSHKKLEEDDLVAGEIEFLRGGYRVVSSYLDDKVIYEVDESLRVPPFFLNLVDFVDFGGHYSLIYTHIFFYIYQSICVYKVPKVYNNKRRAR